MSWRFIKKTTQFKIKKRAPSQEVRQEQENTESDKSQYNSADVQGCLRLALWGALQVEPRAKGNAVYFLSELQ